MFSVCAALSVLCGVWAVVEEDQRPHCEDSVNALEANNEEMEALLKGGRELIAKMNPQGWVIHRVTFFVQNAF